MSTALRLRRMFATMFLLRHRIVSVLIRLRFPFTQISLVRRLLDASRASRIWKIFAVVMAPMVHELNYFVLKPAFRTIIFDLFRYLICFKQLALVKGDDDHYTLLVASLTSNFIPFIPRNS